MLRSGMFRLEIIGLLVISFTLVACQHNLGQNQAANDVGDTISKWGNLIVSKVTKKLEEFVDLDVLREIVVATDGECNHEDCQPDEYIGNIINNWGEFFISKITNKLEEFVDLDAIKKIIDATIEEECSVKECPAGEVVKTNSHYTPSSNGCGSFGLQWKKEMLPDEGLEDCCNVHDYCYDKCGADRDICDLEFKTCLYKICKKRKDEWTLNEMKICKGAAKFMYTATQAFGCKAYQDSQEKACVCVKGVNRQEL